MKNNSVCRLTSIILIILLLSSLVCSCTSNEEKEYYDAYFTAMDAEVTLRLARDSGVKEGKETIYFSDEYLENIVRECANIAEQTSSIFSASNENSMTYEINTESDSFFDLDDEFCELTKRAFDICDKTNGAFDITIGTAIELWNLSDEEPIVPSDEDIAQALSHCGKDKFVLEGNTINKTDRAAKLDFGEIAKGYALSKMIDHLKTTDVLYGVVSFDGNIAVFGTKYDSKQEQIKYKIGITDPADKTKTVGHLYVDNGYVSVAGGCDRTFEVDSVKYNKIIDPATAKPSESDILSVTVICKNGYVADALSTALFVMGSEKAMEYYRDGSYEFEAMMVLNDGTLIVTDKLAENGNFEKYVEPTEEEK